MQFETQPPEGAEHGIRFTNDEWNDSIANGNPFTVKWNEAIIGKGAQLGLFKVTYPRNGVIEYEPVANITDSISGTSHKWTPDDLEEGLYTLWLTTASDANRSWAMSPPWTVQSGRQGIHWAAPVGVPIVVMIGLYILSVTTCILYRRRNRKRLERKEAAAEHLLEEDGRHPSVSSESSTSTYVDDVDEKAKTETKTIIITKSGDEITRPPEVLLDSTHQQQRHGSASTTMSGTTWNDDASPEKYPMSRKGSTWSDDAHFDGLRFGSRPLHLHTQSASSLTGPVQFSGVRFDRGRSGSVPNEGVPPVESRRAAPGTAI